MNEFEDYLNKINTISFNKIPSGEYLNINNIFEKVILPNMPLTEIILKWHNLLKIYIESENPIFFIRRYSSDPNKDWKNIRRGFLTENNEYSYVFCDNYLAHYFFTMALNNYVPKYEEFYEIIKNRKMPYGYRDTKQEKEIQAYKKGKTVRINEYGWKLSHIFSVNENDYNFNYNNEKKELFPRGEYNDWKYYESDKISKRYLKIPKIEKYYEKTVAHFIRLIHPINYFITPQRKYSNIDIGENKDIILLVKKYYKKNMGKIFNEFTEIIMGKEIEDKTKDTNIFYKCDYNYVKKDRENIEYIKQKRTPKDNINYDRNDIRDIVIAYLKENKSYRTIESEIMGKEYKSRGGGFKAKKILNSYGIEGKHKGIIKSDVDLNNIDFEDENKMKNDILELLKMYT